MFPRLDPMLSHAWAGVSPPNLNSTGSITIDKNVLQFNYFYMQLFGVYAHG